MSMAVHRIILYLLNHIQLSPPFIAVAITSIRFSTPSVPTACAPNILPVIGLKIILNEICAAPG